MPFFAPTPALTDGVFEADAGIELRKLGGMKAQEAIAATPCHQAMGLSPAPKETVWH